MRTRKRLVFAVVISISISSFVIAPPVGAGGKSRPVCIPPQNVVQPLWTEIPKPDFPPPALGDNDRNHQTVTSWVTDPYFPDRIYVTNGFAVLASVDNGCSWKQVYALDVYRVHIPTQPYASRIPTPTITDLTVAPDKARPGTVYFIRSTMELLPTIVSSSDGGATWVETSLPPAEGGATTYANDLIGFSPADPKVGYLITNYGAGYSFQRSEQWFQLRRTTDGGKTWVEVFNKMNPDRWTEITMDPGNPDHLWALLFPFSASVPGSSDILHESQDGGETWTPVTGLAQRPSGDARLVTWVKSGVTQVAIYSPRLVGGATVPERPPFIVRSFDGGKTWTEMPLKQMHESEEKPNFENPIVALKGELGFVTTTGDFNTADDDKVYRFDPRSGKWVLVGPHFPDFLCVNETTPVGTPPCKIELARHEDPSGMRLVLQTRPGNGQRVMLWRYGW